MPTWENTLKPKRDVSLEVAVAIAHFLGYTFLQYQEDVFAIMSPDTALLTSHSPLE